MKILSRDEITTLRERYPPGSRIVLGYMDDPYHPVEPGTKGTLKFIDDLGTFHVTWDNGRTLGLVYGVDRFSVMANKLEQTPNDPGRTDTQTASSLTFIFDDEICISDDSLCLEGYLIASDSLVARLKQQGQQHLSPDALSSMENINFYPVYHVQNESVTLHSHFYTMSAAGEQSHGFVLPLSTEESHSLISGFESYCQSRYKKSCVALLNDMRKREGKPPLPKPPLQQRIQDTHVARKDAPSYIQHKYDRTDVER